MKISAREVENLNREKEITKKNQMEIPELKK